MTFNKLLLFLSLFAIVMSVYFYHTMNKQSLKENIFELSFKVLRKMKNLIGWCSSDNSVGSLRRKLEELMSNYVYNSLNTSGLIIGLRQFDGVEVIVFDVMHHDRKRPAIVYIHGGGWTRMNPRAYSSVTAELARQLNTLVVSVDYRKAPEHPYPAAFDDVLKAVKYFFSNAAIFDVDPNRVAVMGDSAGGNLATAVTYHLSSLRQHNSQSHSPKLLVPLYPTLQMADMLTPSYMDNVHDVVLSKHEMLTFCCNYAFGVMTQSDLYECIDTMASNGHLDDNTQSIVKGNMNWAKYLTGPDYDNRPNTQFHHKSNRFAKHLSQLIIDPRFSPLSALNDTQLTLLPPMFVFGASMDPLRDDAKLLAARATFVGNIATYIEIGFYHDPLIFFIIGLPKSGESFNRLIAIFKNDTIL